jgi:uncharacterized protein
VGLWGTPDPDIWGDATNIQYTWTERIQFQLKSISHSLSSGACTARFWNKSGVPSALSTIHSTNVAQNNTLLTIPGTNPTFNNTFLSIPGTNMVF